MKLAKIVTSLRRFQGLVGVAVILLTAILFVRFFTQHPQYITSLRHVSLWAVLSIIGLNALLLIVLAVIYQATLALCGHRLPFKEQLLLTAYSSLANFFGPLQSGPGVRAVYLKSKHHVHLRDYMVATLLYYACFATVSAAFLFGGSRPWWQTLAGCTAVVACSWVVITWFMRRQAKSAKTTGLQLLPRPLITLLLATIVQITIVAAYYSLELRAIGAHASLGHMISYAGAANFGLFVSLTPDAIGIRESFLVITKRLHHLSTAAIITANVLDRAAYVLFLGFLLIIIIAVHAKDSLDINRLQPKS